MKDELLATMPVGVRELLERIEAEPIYECEDSGRAFREIWEDDLQAILSALDRGCDEQGLGVPLRGQPALVADATGAASAGVSAHSGDGQAQGCGR